jgi:hypothetical protein
MTTTYSGRRREANSPYALYVYALKVEHRPQETTAFFDDLKARNVEVSVYPPVEFMDDPCLWLEPYHTGDTQNWGRFSDPKLGELYGQQARTLDRAERKRLVNEFERTAMENAHYIPGLWWTRNVVHWAKVKNYVAPPNQLLQPEAPGRLAIGGLRLGRDGPERSRGDRHRRPHAGPGRTLRHDAHGRHGSHGHQGGAAVGGTAPAAPCS